MKPLQTILKQLISDPRYQQNLAYGTPRPGHPEGSVRAHIAELEANLERLRPRLRSDDDYWQLRFLIHVHDTFKAEAQRQVPIEHPRSHASLARAFASEFTDDADLLAMVQFHDVGYALWRQSRQQGRYNQARLQQLLKSIRNWDLFLLFMIVDGCTAGKNRAPVRWFLQQVKHHRSTDVDESWLL